MQEFEGLRALAVHPVLSTSTDDILDTFYVPALRCSLRYDRGVGFFSSAWLRLAASGLAAFASNGGRARIIASPIMSAEDCAALTAGEDARADERLKDALLPVFHDLETHLETDTLAALAWMVADGLLEFRVALTTGALDGDFHDKFGVFTDAAGDRLAFHGSPNDSAQAFRNYESISIYASWVDAREEERVTQKQAYFERLWHNRDANLRVYAMPEAVRRNLLSMAERLPRPYVSPIPAEPPRWRHQKAALGIFLNERAGILEMATGTGKTRTALAILNELETRAMVSTAIVCANGTDLLDQWHGQLLSASPWPVYRAYASHHEGARFLRHPHQSVLLCSRRQLCALLPRLAPDMKQHAFIVCDEVHGMGSPMIVSQLKGELRKLAYRLGLSATPDREYDEVGNLFIEEEIGPVIFEFGLEEAIRRGILCEFDYVPLSYRFSDEDREAIRQAFRRHAARKRNGEVTSDEALFRDLARVRKVSKEKLAPFAALIAARPELLKRSIIFVEEAEYGALVQDLLMPLHLDYHTYYGDDDRENLIRFARGELDCLLTCHRISEGIDISSLNNVILFSSSRARLETVQRLGRCLRLDPANPAKRASVVDFIRLEEGDDDRQNPELDADATRAAWLTDLSRVRNEIENPGVQDAASGGR